MRMMKFKEFLLSMTQDEKEWVKSMDTRRAIYDALKKRKDKTLMVGKRGKS